MANPIRSFLSNLRLPSIFPLIEEVEKAYLNGAESASDLEMRQREIDRGKFRRLNGWNF